MFKRRQVKKTFKRRAAFGRRKAVKPKRFAKKRFVRKPKMGRQARVLRTGSKMIQSFTSPVFKVPSQVVGAVQQTIVNVGVTPTIGVAQLGPTFLLNGSMLSPAISNLIALGSTEFAKWDWIRMHFIARVQLIASNTPATPDVMLNLPGVQAWWAPNFDMDAGLTSVTIATAQSTRVPAKADKNGQFHFTVMWRNKNAAAQGQSMPLTMAAGSAFPYSVTQFLVLLNAAATSGAKDPVRTVTWNDYGLETVLRIPAFMVEIPAAVTGITAINADINVSWTIDAGMSIYNS